MKTLKIALLLTFLLLLQVTASAQGSAPPTLYFTEDGEEKTQSIELTFISENAEIDMSDAQLSWLTKYGVFTLQENGDYTYRPNTLLPEVQALSGGKKTLKENVVCTCTDKNGRTQKVTLPFTIGADTAPVSGNINEGADIHDAVLRTEYGTAQLLPNGSVQYTLRNSARAVQALTGRETGQETLRILAIFADGTQAEDEVLVIVSGQNDSPYVRSFSHQFTTRGTAQEIHGNALEGSALGDGYAWDHTFLWTSEPVSAYGTVTLSQDGQYTLSLSPQTDAALLLLKGETAEEVFTYQYKDKNGTKSVGKVTLQVIGGNRVPVMKDQTFYVTEDSGSYTVCIDPLKGAVMGDRTHTGEWHNLLSYANFINPIIADVAGPANFLINNDAAEVQALGDGKTLSAKYSFTLTDEDGDSSTGSMTIIVVGTNDTPAVQSFAYLIQEKNVDNTVSGNALDVSTKGDGAHAFEWKSAATSEYGNVALNADGSYSYTLNNNHPDVQALGAGDRLPNQVYSYTYTDEDGETATGSVTISIIGVNNTPTVQSFSHYFKKNSGDYTVSGNALTGCTKGDGAHTFAWSLISILQNYGTLTTNNDGSYTYMMNNAHADVQVLGEGDSIVGAECTFIYTDADGEVATGTVTIYITGAD